MILVDASVWIDHFRSAEPLLVRILMEQQAAVHPAVIGELACGSLKNRESVLRDLGDLPRVAIASLEEVLVLIETHSLMGRGIGYVDAQLLASCALSAGTTLWTRDHRLRRAAETVGVKAGVDSSAGESDDQD